ncbi:hypothetical protein ACVIGA_002211 [Bradyrhizobium sp. USDA 3240]
MRFPHAGNHVRAWNMMRFKIRNVAGMFAMRAFDGHEGSSCKTRLPRGGVRRAHVSENVILRQRPQPRAG